VTRLIVFAFEKRWQGDLEILDHLLDRVAKRNRSAGWKLNGDRSARIVKIIDVNPIAWRRSIRLRASAHRVDHLLHAAARRADHKEVEARFSDLRAELQYAECALQADQPIQGLSSAVVLKFRAEASAWRWSWLKTRAAGTSTALGTLDESS